MKMKNKILMGFLAITLFTVSGCETFDLDQTENPSTLSKEFLDPVYSFNYVQLTLPDFVSSTNAFTQQVTRQMAMTGGNSYENAFAAVNSNENWTTGYLILNAIKTMEPKAIENRQTFILGASKVIRCYVLMTMADLYGNIPYSEALMGGSNLTPRYDDSADVYAGVYDELNQAIEYLSVADESSAGDPRDLYFGGVEGTPAATRWITVAKTLKLKMLNNVRLLESFGSYNVESEVDLLLAENDLINSADKDFQFKYGTNRVNPNSRHPLYNNQYEFNGGSYIANYFFWTVSVEKGSSVQARDPREPYYFYRQSSVNNSTSSQVLPCKDEERPSQYNNDQFVSFYNGAISQPFCFTNGYLGRDHGDDSGIPADNDVRTVVGLYPIGGKYGQTPGGVQNGGTDGALGEGIMPIMLTSYVNFIKAELLLALKTDAGLAKVELEAGIRASISKVTTFLPDQPGEINPTDSAVNNYVNFVLAKYDVPETNKLELIIKEYFIAAWGNGIEPYNNYRKTGYPSNFQPTLEQPSGPFYSTAFYSDYSVNNNPNTPNNVRTRKVFWDVANIELH